MDVNTILRKYMDGSCTAEEERAARKWLERHVADPSYDRMFEDILAETPVSENEDRMRRSWMRLETLMDNEAERQRRDKRRRRGFGWANAGVIAAFVIAFLVIFKTTEPVQWHEVYAARGETEKITLSDGTDIWLNSGTKVIYPSRFDSNTRNIFVDGEIYADVTPDKNKPFIVSTSEINVKVHGTKFCVKSFAQMQNVEVALISGSVTVGDNGNEVFSRTLKPGELIRYNHQFGTVEQYDINPETFGSWKNNRNMSFINESLEDIAQDLERHFDVEILIEDQTLAKTQYYASFVNNESLEKILQALNSNGTMKITKRHDTIVISLDN